MPGQSHGDSDSVALGCWEHGASMLGIGASMLGIGASMLEKGASVALGSDEVGIYSA